ncbi:MAG: hypothetical protein HY051_04190 [Candidatus Aenigmarchaeota archaeon]|nr:hypothetical protein [Candidatus Aenigmarchaeota archaeon]
MSMWDKLFWAWFALGGFSLAYSLYSNPLFSVSTGLLIAVAIVSTGLVKLTQEVAFKELKEVNLKILDALHWIKEGISKVGLANGKIEDDEQHTMLTKKILELENRMNRVSKALTAEIVDIKSKQGDADFVEIKQDTEQKQE